MRLVDQGDRLFNTLAIWAKDKELNSLVDTEHLTRSDLYFSLMKMYSGPNATAIGVLNESKDEFGGAFFLSNIEVGVRAEFHLVFLKGYRGKFLLKAYKKFLIFVGKMYGIKVLTGFVPSFNEKAIKFLKRMSWSEIGVIPRYYIRKDKPESANVFYLELNVCLG
jgi:RimJ/RimL family protein N-acetyltransferase